MRRCLAFLAMTVTILFPYSTLLLAQQDTTPPKVERTIPDFKKRVPTDIKEIRIVFSERMDNGGFDITYYTLPVGKMRWEDDNRTFVIPITRQLLSSKIYKLTLNGVDGYFRDVAGNPLSECTLTFTTEGTEPVTPASVDATPPRIDAIHITSIEDLDLSKDVFARVSANPAEGFHFPYYLFIPQSLDRSKPVHLLIEPCNTGTTSDAFSVHERKAKSLAMGSHANQIARKLKTPLLVPVFPRPQTAWQIYTHALDRDTLLIQNGSVRRIDLQLLKMIEHAQELLRRNNVQVKEKVFMHGFSASGTFTNRFAILHPTVVRAVAAGGVNSIPTFPTSLWKDTTMRYPVGIADLKEIAGISFDEAAYKQVSQYIYMGALDTDDTIPYQDAYDEADAELVKKLIGAKMMPDRWNASQTIYKQLGIPAQFVTYNDTGHEIRTEMIDDIVKFFVANSEDTIVEIKPYE